MDTPRIYVASLSDYNAGILHGAWIDANQDEDDIREEIKEMLAESRNQPAEDYAIHDYEGFCGIKISEYSGIDEIAAIAEAIEEHGEKFALVYDDLQSIDAAIEACTDRYYGEFDEVEDYAYDFLHDCYEIPDYLENYIDYEAFGRDLQLGGDIEVYQSSDYTYHIFGRG